MAANVNELDYFRRGESFRGAAGKTDSGELDYFRRGEIVITVSVSGAAAVGPITLRPNPATVTWTAPTPTVQHAIIIQPPAPTVRWSMPQPAVVIGGDITIIAPAASVLWSVPASTVSLSGVPVGSSLPGVTFTPGTDWRLVLCDINGIPISLVSRLAHSKQVIVQLNRPTQSSFVIAADDERVNELHSDGLPYFWPGARTMKWYRKEAGAWVLRFAGYVWAINPAERDTESSVVDIAVTCYDPMQRLMKRLCRDAAGGFASSVNFTSTPGATIAKALVDRTILYGGPLGIQTTGTFGGATTPQTVRYDQQFVAQALIDLTNTMTLDLTFQPVDRDDGILVSMGAVAQRGVDRPGVIFGYDAIPHSALGFNRTITMDDFANDLTLYSAKKSLTAHRADANSKARYGAYEDAQVLTSISAEDFLDTIADTEIQLRKNPSDLLGVRPVPERSPSPWLDFHLGDRVNVEWSSNTGAAGSGMQRIYGYTLDIDDQGFETISELVVSADAESA